MNLNNYKEYLPFYAILGLFFILISFLFFMYIKWDKAPEKMDNHVEVSLPVIDWENYTNLSKQYSNGRIKDVQKN